MTTKFNQEMYAKMRSKKNVPLSNLGKRIMRVVVKRVSVTLAILGTETTRTTSPATLVEEITPIRKKPRMVDKGKEMADSRLSSVWDDAGLALARTQEAFTAKELKVFSGTSSNGVVGRHIHKLIQVLGESLHTTLEFLTHQAKFASTVSRVEALEAEISKFKKDLISAMDKANNVKEKVKVLGDDLRAERQLKDN